MIQDIFPEIFSSGYASKAIKDDSIVFCFKDNNVLCDENDGIAFPTQKHIKCEKYIYLFSLSGTDYFLARQDLSKIPAGYMFENTSLFNRALPNHMAFAGVTAQHLNNWYEANRYCGKCGNTMEHDSKERMVKCALCGNSVYPKISPVVIVGVTHGNKLLMTRYAYREYKGYALVAGFIEVGESAEDAVKREVFEETGVKVKNIKYYKSQPWGFSESLLLGFFAELDGAEALTVDRDELSEAVWVEKEDIDIVPDNFSLTNEMMCHFKDLV